MQAFHTRTRPENYAAPVEQGRENPEDIVRPSACGEDASVGTRERRHPCFFEQTEQVAVGEAMEGVVEEALFPRKERRTELFHPSGMGDVAFSPSGDQDLDAGFAVSFQEEDAGAERGGPPRGDEAGRTGADNDNGIGHCRKRYRHLPGVPNEPIARKGLAAELTK